jgi:hypothetical protein
MSRRSYLAASIIFIQDRDRIGSWIDAIFFVARAAIKMNRCFGGMTSHVGQFRAFHAKRDALRASCPPKQASSSSERPFFIKMDLQVVRFAEKLNIPRRTRM